MKLVGQVCLFAVCSNEPNRLTELLASDTMLDLKLNWFFQLSGWCDGIDCTDQLSALWKLKFPSNDAMSQGPERAPSGICIIKPFSLHSNDRGPVPDSENSFS